MLLTLCQRAYRQYMAVLDTPRVHPTATAQVAWRSLGVIIGATAVLLLLTNGRYGYFGDELYFVAAGHHPAWGYADQPSLVPMLAGLMDAIAPGSVWWLRLPATIATCVAIALAGLLAAELGGNRRAQVLTAVATAISTLEWSHFLYTSTFDIPVWTAITLLLVRWVRTRQDRLLLWSGLLTAVSLQIKFLIPGFWVVLGLSALLLGPRDLLRRPMLWIGAAIAVALTVPSLLWQWQWNLPQVAMTAVIGEENDAGGGRWLFPAGILFSAGLLAGLVLFGYGVYVLLRSPLLRDYRFLGASVLAFTVLMVITNGRPYYLMGLFPLCFAAGTVALQHRAAARWWGWTVSATSFALCGLVMVAANLPLRPESWLPRSTSGAETLYQLPVYGQLDWEQVAASTGEAYQHLPVRIRERTAVMADSFWSIGALDTLGPEHGLPDEVYGGHRGAWYFGAPPESATAVLYLGDDNRVLRDGFDSATQVGTVRAPQSLYDGAPIFLYQGREKSWDSLWPQLRTLSWRDGTSTCFGVRKLDPAGCTPITR
ncbi:glycosyl transferase, family 39 [Pseudonocardiaceae bacterium YIM PH 21723]|nr:glycosyl transferase, family 39 [Pseudonocardiaceae bacterium YIM PH 21723]